MYRLLAGTPLRSSGRLSVSQLAIEAGIKRWHLTHQHLDLKELFEARVKAATTDRHALTQRLSEYELKDKHAKLIKHCAELEERLQTYVSEGPMRNGGGAGLITVRHVPATAAKESNL